MFQYVKYDFSYFINQAHTNSKGKNILIKYFILKLSHIGVRGE